MGKRFKGWILQCICKKKDKHKLRFMFDGKIYMFQRFPIGSSSSPNIFTDFMHFPIWAMKQDRLDLHYKEVDEFIINLNDFIKDPDVIEEGSTAMLALLIYYYWKDILLRKSLGTIFTL